MGILNTTPDSFSDGGLYAAADAALHRALEMVRAGAHIIDIGGESTRPFSEPVALEEELKRVIPVIERLRPLTDALISVDTTKADVARAAVGAGADIINDVSGLQADPSMVSVARETCAGLVVMHRRAPPKTMQLGDLSSPDIVGDVAGYLSARAVSLAEAGVQPEAICVDPGIGFGKTVQQNLKLIGQLDRFIALGFPVLMGPSRKSFLGAITGRPVDDRLAATAASCVLCYQGGAHILRVHDVAEIASVVAVCEAMEKEMKSPND